MTKFRVKFVGLRKSKKAYPSLVNIIVHCESISQVNSKIEKRFDHVQYMKVTIVPKKKKPKRRKLSKPKKRRL